MGSWQLRSVIFFASTKIVHRPEFDSALHFNIRNVVQIRIKQWNASARRSLPAALLERWPQVCCVNLKISFGLLPPNSVVSTTTDSMKCLWHWISLRIRVRWKTSNTTLTWIWCDANIYLHIYALMLLHASITWSRFQLTYCHFGQHFLCFITQPGSFMVHSRQHIYKHAHARAYVRF